MPDATTDNNFVAHSRLIFEQGVIALETLTTSFGAAIYVFSVYDFECVEDQNELSLNIPHCLLACACHAR